MSQNTFITFYEKRLFNPTKLGEDQYKLIQRLRKEVDDVKDCFTKFSFQSMLFSAVALGAIGKLQEASPWMALASLIIIYSLRAVCRIGTYKFQTAHRLAGYELHLYRSGHLNESADRWQHEMTQIGWEEAMRAWRVVQPTVFNKLYKKGRWFTTLRPNPFLKKGKGVWFIPHTLVVESASYYVGSYLDTIFRVMNILMIAGIIPLICLFVQVFRAKESSAFDLYGFGELQLSVSILIAASVYVSVVIVGNYQKVRLLGDEILSIHSCAILWQAVVVAHYRALQEALRGEEYKSLRNYTYFLSKEALELASNPYDIHAWISGASREPSH